jgi:hypothetical protein
VIWRRSTGGFWRPEILLISCTALIASFVLVANAVSAALGNSSPLADIILTLFAGLFLLFGGLWGYRLGQDMRHDDDRDIRRSHDLIEYLVFSAVFTFLANLTLRGLNVGASIGPWGLIASIFLGLVFWFCVLKE